MTDREFEIVALDAQGRGVAEGGQIIPFALPGERVRARVGGRLAELQEVKIPAAERAQPFCRYFTRCGGCASQHMDAGLYSAWKRGQVVEVLRRIGVRAEVEPLADAHGAGRRRATFHARFPHGEPDEVGFMRARSHAIVAIEDCPLFAPAMSGASAAARALAANLRGVGKPLDITVTASIDGLDVDLRGSGPLAFAENRKIARTADRLDLARVSNHGATMVERRAPRVTFGDALVILPPGAFLQATEEGEAALAAFVESACEARGKVVDLFCGTGAFALRLARNHETVAVDFDPAAIAALDRAARSTPGLQAVRTEARDLFARPLSPDELRGFEAAVFDPPRAGAEAQAHAFADSALPLVAAISCNAQSFSRDARILLDGGFALDRVSLLDQFKYSPHVEIAAVFRRQGGRKRPRRILG